MSVSFSKKLSSREKTRRVNLFNWKQFGVVYLALVNRTRTSNAEEAEVERFYEGLQDLLELTPEKDVLFIIGDWNAKVGSPETPGITGKFVLGVPNEAGKRLIEFCQENTLVIANTLFQQHKRRFYTWTSPDGQLLGASVRYSARGKGHEEGGSTHAKVGSSLRSPPGNP